MPATESETEALASSLQRGVMGLLLGILFVLGIGFARGLLIGEYAMGVGGVVLTVATAAWMASIFADGLGGF